MQALNLPEYHFTIRAEAGENYIFDEIRKKYLLLTPEEWVRQNFIKYLIDVKSYRPALICQEYPCKIGKMNQRCDIALFNRKGEVSGVVECKAPSVNITKQVFDQILRYNIELKSGLLIVTNGISHYCCVQQAGEWIFLDDIPPYQEEE
jgi:hypothetical protein